MPEPLPLESARAEPVRYKAAADVGGTFTDFVVLDEATGELINYKLPSTPHAPAAAVVDGFRQISRQFGVPLEAIGLFVHGSTIAVNAIIQRRGVEAGLVVTQGFRDVLEFARARLPEPLVIVPARPVPLIPRYRVLGVPERTTSAGDVLEPLDEGRARAVLAEMGTMGVEAIAIALLNSYANPEHERRLLRLAEEVLPGIPVSVSSELWPEMREYERTIVTVMNAYVHPITSRYVDALLEGLKEIGVPAALYITRSNGGMMSAESARRVPVHTLLSGPASGVVGAAYIARLAGEKQCITVDIGGTSADVSIVRDGEVVYSTENHVAEFPVVMPSADVSTIGAGGGSIAWLDEVGILKVGPQSAGAEPGPACYGRGGQSPTITDAYLACGYVNPDNFLGGRMRLDRALAEEAIRPLAQKLGKGIVETAESILSVASSNMADELRPLTAKRGIDPRDFALLVYGGAGATHGALLVDEAQIGKMLVPPFPGTLCALGALMTDVRGDYIKTLRKDLTTVGDDELLGVYRELEEQALAWVREQGPVVKERAIVRSADLRYWGEPYDVEVHLPREIALQGITPALLRELFHQAHDEAYSFMDRDAAVFVTNIRVRVVGYPRFPRLLELGKAEGEALATARRGIYYRGAWHTANIYDRTALRAGHRIVGPAVVEQVDTTSLIPPGFVATVDRCGILSVVPEALLVTAASEPPVVLSRGEEPPPFDKRPCPNTSAIPSKSEQPPAEDSQAVQGATQ